MKEGEAVGTVVSLGLSLGQAACSRSKQVYFLLGK